MTKVHQMNIDEDQKCPKCGKGGSVNGGLCLSCGSKKIQKLIDELTIVAILGSIEKQLKINARQANEVWAQRVVDKIKVLNVTVIIGRDKNDQIECKLDFGYGEKLGTSFNLYQKALPGI